VLATRGFARYEISNFALEGFAARHNLAYWDGSDYLGLGAGAHSYAAAPEESKADGIYGRRWCNYALPDRYAEAVIGSGKGESWSEMLAFKDAVFEFFFLGLRRIKGVDFSVFEERFGCAADAVFPSALELLAKRRLIRRRGSRLALSGRGLMLADSVIENFSHPEHIPASAPALAGVANG
jgi:oxygen-independent coproporphyrinogen-3 oxidase